MRELGIFLKSLHMEEQKIDLVIASDASQPFVRLALEQGVRLE